jgi:SAM-dependent methyltransferase
MYPAGLEDDLAAHFRRIVRQRVTPDLSRLDAAMVRLRAVPGLSADRIPVESGLPGGAALHKTLARLVSRQTQGILEQVEHLAAALRSVADELSWAVRQASTHVHADLIGQIDALQERLSALERQPLDDPSPAAALAELSRRLERLESVEASRRFQAPYAASEFESAFRGGEDEIKARYRDLAARLEGCSPVLDIGCGRGEFMELLAEIGVQSSGLELDAELAADGRSRGLAITAGDGLARLAGLPDGSLGGLALIQVVEHLSPNQITELVGLAADKLRPGGRAVIETVNPQSLYVFARAFYLDPTHNSPVHPAYLTFLFRRAGFQGLDIDWRSEPSVEESLHPVGQADVDENFTRINRILFGPQDYALIATR